MKRVAPSRISVVDLFCGIGGLSHGFFKEGFKVVAGYDSDGSCEYAYQTNNQARFLEKRIQNVSGREIRKHFGLADVRVLIGCAPCQPFSSYAQKSSDRAKWNLLYEFGRLIKESKPDIVSMENVPGLEQFTKSSVFGDFISILLDAGFELSYKIVDCRRYGIPQHRKRLVLLASKYGPIGLIPYTHTEHQFVSVRKTISNLEKLSHGQASLSDPLHRASQLNQLNLKRVKASKPGGTWRDWHPSLRLKCHLKSSGNSYVGIYGRMLWDEPSPTMTTHCTGAGNGRFVHPEQDRAITLREAALFQTFPEDYEFSPGNKVTNIRQLSTQIGNAVPVQLGQVIAKSIFKHVKEHSK